MRINRTRQLVRDYIYRYDEIMVGGCVDILEYKAEGLGQSLIDANPYWWEPDSLGRCNEKPILYGTPIDQLVQAIETINAFLVNEDAGPEPFDP
jgi:hypothetical protein